jgi:hypothetical protein
MAPISAVRFSKDTAEAVMVSPPLTRPALPMPAMARPAMSMADDVAAPQTADPISKMAKKTKNDDLLLNFW